ncbi:MAG: hypothetical protein KDJ41_06200 [Hyphomicrobiaceae bacterium]|nr:hypothetical protein [Hyphomicrobiaceae bacterium]
MKHPIRLQVLPESLAELAVELGDLRYDALEDFLAALAEKIRADAAKDAARGRRKLAASLESAARRIEASAADIGEAWRISKPHMDDGDA